MLRRLIRLSVSTAPSAGETQRLTAQLAAVADELETHVPEAPIPRFMAPDPEGPPKEVPLGGAMPYDPIVGRFNPLALPVVLEFDPPIARGRAAFDVGYEGAPGCVHGAILVATFDIILTAANAIAGHTGPTVRLGVRYKRPTLCDEEAVFEGWVTEVKDKRIHSGGPDRPGRHRDGRGARRVRHLRPRGRLPHGGGAAAPSRTANSPLRRAVSRSREDSS